MTLNELRTIDPLPEFLSGTQAVAFSIMDGKVAPCLSPSLGGLAMLASMNETIFDKILSGEIPCHKVYEDDQVLAFLDIEPLAPGHTLVIPKERAATLDALSDASAAAIGRVLPRIARAVLAVTGATAFNLLQNNGASAHQAVFHVHFHVIPKLDDGRGLGLGWKTSPLDHEEGAALAAQLSEAVDA